MKNKKLPILTFKTKRLVIRPLELKDFAAWKNAYLKRLPNQTVFDDTFLLKKECNYLSFKELVKSFRSSAKKGLIFQLFAFDKVSGELIGSTQYSLIQRYEVQKAYLGYSILNNYWRQGFGYELANEMINHAFKKLKLHRLEAEILPSNKASIKLSKKLGMIDEGTRRKCLFVNGKWEDHKVFAITAEDRGIFNMKPNKRLL